MLHVSIPIEEDTALPFWIAKLTDITQPPADTTDQNILDQYQQCHIRQEDDGAYCVKFPWKQEQPPLPSNYTVCTKKTRSLVRKLSQDPDLLQLDSKIVTEQEQRGFIEKVTTPDLTTDVHYILHYPVMKASSTTIRIINFTTVASVQQETSA